MRRISWFVLTAFCLAIAAGGSDMAWAAVTIGELAPGSSPPAVCGSSPYDFLQPTVISGNSFVVPAGGAVVTSWSTNAAAGSGQMLTMKVFRKVAEPSTYMVVGHDGPRALTPGTINTFAVKIPVQPGDVLGLNDANATSVNNACIFSTPGESHFERFGDLGDGMSGDFPPADIETDYSVNATAVVKPSNEFSFGKVKRNKRKGTAILTVVVPGPGTVTLSGKGVAEQRLAASSRAARAAKDATAAGQVRLKVRSSGKKKRRLNGIGRVKVKPNVVYTPTGGDPNAQTTRITLIRRLR